MIEQNDPAYILYRKSTPITSTTEKSDMYNWMRKNFKNTSQCKFSIIQFRPTWIRVYHWGKSAMKMLKVAQYIKIISAVDSIVEVKREFREQMKRI